MHEIINQFTAIVENPLQRARKWKQTGKKVIGCFPMYIPEEIVHAGGMLPITLLGAHEAGASSDKYMQPYLCHVARSNFALALEGRLDLLDGIIFPDTCDIVQMLPDIWKLHNSIPFQHSVAVAGKIHTASSRAYIADEFHRMRKSLEAFIGKAIADDELRHSIAIYNRHRDLIQQLYRMRRANPGLLKTSEMAKTVMASMLMPKEEHGALVQQLLEKAKTSKERLRVALRLVIAGSPCDQPEWKLLNLVEELGATVVDDDLYVGRRHFATNVNETISPIDALAERFINDVPCPTKHGQDERYARYLSGLARESKAQGVVILTVKYCEPHGFANPAVKVELEREGIAHLFLEIDPSTSVESVRTRLQAFTETLHA